MKFFKSNKKVKTKLEAKSRRKPITIGGRNMVILKFVSKILYRWKNMGGLPISAHFLLLQLHIFYRKYKTCFGFICLGDIRIPVFSFLPLNIRIFLSDKSKQTNFLGSGVSDVFKCLWLVLDSKIFYIYHSRDWRIYLYC